MEESMKKITKEVAEKIAKLAGKPVLTDDNGSILLLNNAYRFVIVGTNYFPYGLGGANSLRPVLYQLGERIGEDFFKKYADLAGDKSRAIEMVFGMAVYQGFGTFEIMDDEQKDKIVIHFHNSFEVASYKANADKESNSPVCHTTRGFLDAVYSKYFGKRVLVKETSCAAMGKQDFCEFEVEVPKE